MAKFEGRSAHEIAMGSALLVEWLGELLAAKGVVTRDELGAVVVSAEANASTIRSVTSQGAISVMREIAEQWNGSKRSIS